MDVLRAYSIYLRDRSRHEIGVTVLSHPLLSSLQGGFRMLYVPGACLVKVHLRPLQFVITANATTSPSDGGLPFCAGHRCCVTVSAPASLPQTVELP